MGAFENASQVYEDFGRTEPFYAVLSGNRYKRSSLDVEEFYEHGREAIHSLMQRIDDRQLEVGRQRALDFGCGTGRLTYALADYFEEVTGVDVSSTMVATAEENRRKPNCRFLVNKQPDLQLFPDNHFSFVLSDITIQHIPPPASENYLCEFVRLLKPGGLAVFSVPDGPLYRQGGLMDRWHRYYRGSLRPWLKRLRGKYPVHIHSIPRSRVQQLMTQNGANVRSVELSAWERNPRRRFPLLSYWVTKPR